MNYFSRNTSPYIPYFFLSMAWLILMLIVNPIGNFPLNDDWAYAKNVFYLSEHGVLRFSDWPAMTLISQMLWGAAFCKVFGFSFTVLRFSVLLLGLAGLNLMYTLLKKLTDNQLLALFSSLVFFLNPLYFSLSYTFMTDVPFLVSILAALLFYVNYFYNDDKISYLLLAIFFSMLATFIRQTGLILPLTVLAGHFLLNRRFTRQFAWHFVSLILMSAMLYAYIEWLKASGNLSGSFSTGSELLKQGNPGDFLKKIFLRSGILLLYIGLFLLPFLLLIFKSWWKTLTLLQRQILLPLAVLLTLPVFAAWDHVPVSNLLSRYGLAPRLLKDAYWGMNLRPFLPDFGFFVLKIAGTIGSFLIIFYLLCNVAKFPWKNSSDQDLNHPDFGRINQIKLRFISLVMICAYWLFLMLGNYFFDRYYLFFLPFFILLFIPVHFKSSALLNGLAIVVLAIYGFFSVAGTHDYLDFNRARWQALNKLLASGISPAEIDGGFEFNGWYQTHARNPDTDFGKSWWFVKDDRYLIASGDFCGFQKKEKYYFPSYLSFSRDSVFIYERIDNAGVDTISIFCSAEETKILGGKGYFLTNFKDIYCEAGKGRTDSVARTGGYSVMTNSENPFAFTIQIDDVLPCETITMGVYTKNNLKNAAIVASTPDARTIYLTETVVDTINSSEWKYIELKVRRPQYMPGELVFYVWHIKGEPVFFDDFTIQRLIPDYPQNQLKD
jgi:hypothetical protein